jgi:hypothetical protein
MNSMQHIKTKTVNFISIVLILIVMFSTINVSAKMVGISPEYMVHNSDLIIVGTILDEYTNGTVTSSTINVERVLKGYTTDKTIKITTNSKPKMDSIPVIIPKKGTEIMVLFEEGQLTADFNNIAVIKGNRVTLVSGIGYGYNNTKWSISDYENEYSKLLNSQTWIYSAIITVALLFLFLLVYVF